MDIRHIDAYLVVLLRLDTLGESHCLGLHLTVRTELLDGLHTLVRRHDGGETAVSIILEFLDGHTTTEAASVGQLTRMVEEVAMTLVVGHTTVVRKRIRLAERHDLACIGPGT